MLHESMSPSSRFRAGFTLLEILVTLIVVTIGLLGLAGLQMTGLRHNHDAYIRSQAALQAYDIADRMQANLVKAKELGNPYDSRGTATYTYSTIGTADATCENATGSGCSTTALAANDMFRWKQALRALLPSGIGIVCRDSSTPPNAGSYNPTADSVDINCSTSGNPAADPYVVKIWWVDDRSATVSSFVTVIGPVR